MTENRTKPEQPMQRKQTKKSRRRKILLSLLLLFSFLLLFVLSVNGRVLSVSPSLILTPEEAEQLTDVDCILVLGCKVYADGTPSAMLRDRLLQGVALQKAAVSDLLLMSGDHSSEDYNEVGAMKSFAIEQGVASEKIFLDHAGFSTYESVYRAKEVFGAKRIVIVSQSYHLPRALYIAKRLGLEAYGVSSDLDTYAGQVYRDLREVAARLKDFFVCFTCPEPSGIGDPIPLTGNGDSTNG